SWPSADGASEHHMMKLDRSRWLHALHGSDPRLTALVSFFYADDRVRCAEVKLPRSRETEPSATDWEKLYYVTPGTFPVTRTGTGQSLRGAPHDAISLPPGITHSLQAFGDEAAIALLGMAR